MLYFNGLGVANIKFPIIKIPPRTTGVLPTYERHMWRSQLTFGFEKGRWSGRPNRPRQDDSAPKIASFRPSKVSDY